MTQRIREDLEENTGPGVSTTAVGHAVNLLGIFDSMTFPASKMELIAHAEDRGASEDVLDHLQAMPDDIYNSLADLNSHANDIEIIEESGNLWSSEDFHDLPDEAERFISDLNGRGRV
jgi:hypothetical protein